MVMPLPARQKMTPMLAWVQNLTASVCSGVRTVLLRPHGTNVPDTYRPITSPGVWVPTTLPVFAQYAQAKPWVLKSADQFRPGPPPALSSALYARDYNETKNVADCR